MALRFMSFRALTAHGLPMPGDLLLYPSYRVGMRKWVAAGNPILFIFAFVFCGLDCELLTQAFRTGDK